MPSSDGQHSITLLLARLLKYLRLAVMSESLLPNRNLRVVYSPVPTKLSLPYDDPIGTARYVTDQDAFFRCVTRHVQVSKQWIQENPDGSLPDTVDPEDPQELTGSITGPLAGASVGVGAVFSVAASQFPVYAALLLNGVQQGTRLFISSTGQVSLTPQEAGTYTAAIYAASTGGTAIDDTAEFEVEDYYSISGPASQMYVNQPGIFTVSAGQFPVYVDLLLDGATQLAGRILVPAPGQVGLIPITTGTHIAAVYNVAGGGVAQAQTSPFNVQMPVITGTLVGPEEPAVVDVAAEFSQVATSYPVWAILRTAGADYDYLRTPLYASGVFNLTPNVSGSHTARLYSAAIGGSLIAETTSFNVTLNTCTVTLPVTAITVPGATPGTGNVVVTANHPYCAWTYFSNVPWVTVGFADSELEDPEFVGAGSGSGTIPYAWEENTSGASRVAIIGITGVESYTIFQAGGTRYFGVSESPDVSGAEVQAMPHDGIVSMVKILNVSPAGEYVTYAYPASYEEEGSLLSITEAGDPGTDLIGNFTQNTFAIDGIPYVVWTSNSTYSGDKQFTFAA